MNYKKWVFDMFIKLIETTTPYGRENKYTELLKEFGFEQDAHGNFYKKIGETETIFSAHLDTASIKEQPVNHIYDGRFIKTDGKTILGADDKAGVTIILSMIKRNVPGLYYLFAGEESGGIGSYDVVTDWIETNEYKNYKRIISFDRRGYNDIIVTQGGDVCCSEKFGYELSNMFSKEGLFYNLSGGIFTDSKQFIEIIPECTNISVGYFNEHSFNEMQDMDYLVKIVNAVGNIKWENLGSYRKIDEIEKDIKYFEMDDFDYYLNRDANEEPFDPNFFNYC